MAIESSIPHQNASTKNRKVHRSRLSISSKIVAFDVLTNLEHCKRTARGAAAMLEVPNSTMQSWRAQKHALQVPLEWEEFFSSTSGIEFLQRNVMAAHHVIHYGPSGVQGMQEYLRLSRIDSFVASSSGTLQGLTERYEEHIIAFGDNEEKRLTRGMKARKITAALDEMFRGRQPCLVAIEVVSNFILLEKFTRDRKAETWKQEINTRLSGLKVEIDQVVSDLGTGITACTKELGANHSPDLFHGQYELSKAVSGALATQKRSFDKELKEAEERVQKTVARYGAGSEKAKQAIGVHNLRQYGLEERSKRLEASRTAIKAIGNLHHPIDLTTGQIQTVEAIKQGFDNSLEALKRIAEEAQLSQSCHDRLEKARRAFDGMVNYIKLVLTVLAAYVGALQLNDEQKRFFIEVIYPLAYIRMIWRRQKRKEREKLKELKEALEIKIREGPWSETLKNEWMAKGKECAERFQRSSSCVEGRNGMLSLLHHRQHRLNERKLRALKVVHNYHILRKDGTTGGERFFGVKHENLFESLVTNVRIPGRPQQQYHDQEKRSLGWKKRLAA
jgi:hypothetical protein